MAYPSTVADGAGARRGTWIGTWIGTALTLHGARTIAHDHAARRLAVLKGRG